MTTPDGRPLPPLNADERATLEGWLDFHRETLAAKCAGLTDERLRTESAAPSRMTLLGLVQHMAEIERHWFRRVFAGDPAPALYEEGEGDGFALVPGRGLDEALAAWRAEVARGRELTAGSSLGDTGLLPGSQARHLGGREVSLRWILAHLVEEYARHNGHADLLRERIDGATGA